MDTREFRRFGREMVDYIADYLEDIRERPVVHRVKPGYLKVRLLIDFSLHFFAYILQNNTNCFCFVLS